MRRRYQCFNPRARVGRDWFTSICPCLLTRFNPRARVGRDDTYCCSHLTYRVSIHAPAWGATGSANHGAHPLAVSIHAPAWGATRSMG